MYNQRIYDWYMLCKLIKEYKIRAYRNKTGGISLGLISLFPTIFYIYIWVIFYYRYVYMKKLLAQEKKKRFYILYTWKPNTMSSRILSHSALNGDKKKRKKKNYILKETTKLRTLRILKTWKTS